MEFTEQQISDFLVELKRQAKGRPYIGGWIWKPLEAIAGEQAYKVFSILCERLLLKPVTVPGCYGHCNYYFTD